MKNFILPLAICLSLSGFTQSTNGVDLLAFKNFYFQVYSDGTVRDFSKQDIEFRSLLYSCQIWLQGVDDQFQLFTAAQTYGNRVDFLPGPISNDPNASAKYDRVWLINKKTISDFRANPGAPIPSIIADWPAHGDTSFGEATNLAPFVDVNNDGIYDPQNGDYPCIPGDKAIFFMFNDLNGLATDMGIEIHGMAYVLDQGGYMDSTFFIDYKIFNRSTKKYTNMRLGLFSDFDIGGSGDDLIGTDIQHSAIYGYNSDRNDSQPLAGFGYSLASAAMIWLKGPDAPYFDAIDNDRDGCIDGIIDPNGNCVPEDPASGINEHWELSNSFVYEGFSTPAISPENDPQIFTHLLMGNCHNGMPKTEGNGAGLWDFSNLPFSCSPPPGSIVDFVYTGNSFDPTGTFKPYVDLNWFQPPGNGGDIKAFGGSGPFDLDIGSSIELSVAYTWHHADSAQSSVDAGLGGLLNKVRRVKTNYDPQINAFNCIPSTIGLTEEKLSLFDYYYDYNKKSIELINNSRISLQLEAYSINGQKITDISLLPNSHASINTSSYPSGIWILRELQGRQSVKILVR